MSEDRPAVNRILQLLAERLESWLEGDELAFETLGERLEESRLGEGDLQSAVLVLKSLAAESAGGYAEATHRDDPGAAAQRVPSAEERRSLSPEAWGTLLDLKRRGSLDAGQLERVLEILGGIGVRPIGVDLALEVATRVALLGSEGGEEGEITHGEVDLAN